MAYQTNKINKLSAVPHWVSPAYSGAGFGNPVVLINDISFLDSIRTPNEPVFPDLDIVVPVNPVITPQSTGNENTQNAIDTPQTITVTQNSQINLLDTIKNNPVIALIAAGLVVYFITK